MYVFYVFKNKFQMVWYLEIFHFQSNSFRVESFREKVDILYTFKRVFLKFAYFLTRLAVKRLRSTWKF